MDVFQIAEAEPNAYLILFSICIYLSWKITTQFDDKCARTNFIINISVKLSTIINHKKYINRTAYNVTNR